VFCRLGESGIVADEMGLGKTIQIIAYVAWMRDKPVQDGPVLIVVPLSTLRNWVNEFHRFAPSVPVVEYHGSPEERAELRRRHIPGLPRFATTPPKKKGSYSHRRGVAAMERGDRCSMPVFITTYSIAMNDAGVLGKSEWGWLVRDAGR
jgi:ATP-dependent DNA helicase